MSRTLELEVVDDERITVRIHSEAERDVSVTYDARYLILGVARVMGWSVFVDEKGGAEADLGASGG